MKPIFGPGDASQRRSESATCVLIAMHDKNDHWSIGKQIHQLADVRRTPCSVEGSWIVGRGTQIHLETQAIELLSRTYDAPHKNRDLLRWHSRRKRLCDQSSFLQSSTLLIPNQLTLAARSEGFLEGHAAWGWIVGAQQFIITEVYLCASHTSHHGLSKEPGVTRMRKWQQSIPSFEAILRLATPKSRADYLLTIPALMVTATGDFQGIFQAVSLANGGGVDSTFHTLWILYVMRTVHTRIGW